MTVNLPFCISCNEEIRREELKKYEASKIGKYYNAIGSDQAPDQTNNVVVESGEAIMKEIYECPTDLDLDTLRYKTFMKQLATSKSSIKPQYLPPTRDSTARSPDVQVFVLQYLPQPPIGFGL